MFLLFAMLFFQFPVLSHSGFAAMSAIDAPAAGGVTVAPESASDSTAVEAAPESDAVADPSLNLAPNLGSIETATAFMPGRLVPEPVALVANPQPVSGFVATPGAGAPVAPIHSSRARIIEMSSRRVWLGLSVAEHSTAAFDAWSTRRVLSQGYGYETNPLLRPFAGNASLYAAIQVSPAIIDYLSHRMMTSGHGWMRHTWWIPQVVSTAISVSSGVHNLGVYSAR